MSKAVGIYNVYGIKDERRVIIDHKENIYPKDGEKINDVLIDKYTVIDDVYGEINACNLTDAYLISSKTLPVLYLSVTYQKSFRCVLLYRIYLYFTIEDEIKSCKELIGNPINGKFSLKIFINNKEQLIDSDIGVYIGNDGMYNKLRHFTVVNEMKEIISVMVEEIQQKFSEMYKDEMNSFEVPDNIITLKNYMLIEKE